MYWPLFYNFIFATQVDGAAFIPNDFLSTLLIDLAGQDVKMTVAPITMFPFY